MMPRLPHFDTSSFDSSLFAVAHTIQKHLKQQWPVGERVNTNRFPCSVPYEYLFHGFLISWFYKMSIQCLLKMVEMLQNLKFSAGKYFTP